ncbi:hypothetical protein MBM_08287 [Drepanopeziza brunnea f. sp. 'multigermtubi' MB_m1]|uniref:Uncharacterized protein n=1 Tax=Marssonina brunnea f. sp. multigermtubi (strain MB_m1) TaxID=1072389 RepID=K1XM75_MARBU|nr:uncharacterized protein MBM_08287 [Drepanopeziza brunnea f. sp. 'multigermtubi' MB_m1]EKD13569.1 hypothetical protein MBM_08287 [Drepanopeziza brunnea f. sp. 'multigermtubi' MB_m1]
MNRASETRLGQVRTNGWTAGQSTADLGCTTLPTGPVYCPGAPFRLPAAAAVHCQSTARLDSARLGSTRLRLAMMTIESPLATRGILSGSPREVTSVAMASSCTALDQMPDLDDSTGVKRRIPTGAHLLCAAPT